MDNVTLNSPMAGSAKEITKALNEALTKLVTDDEMRDWEGYYYSLGLPGSTEIVRLIATVRHYQQRVRGMETLCSLAQSHILALQTELMEAKSALIEAQQMMEGGK